MSHLNHWEIVSYLKLRWIDGALGILLPATP